MTLDQDKLEQQIARCRRLAAWITDVEVRDALERLAEQYEAQLDKAELEEARSKQRTDSFMLGRASPRG